MSYNWDWDFFASSIPEVMKGMPSTLMATLLSSVIGLLLGALLAIVDYAQVPVLRTVARVYLAFLRNTPLMVQLYLAFFGLPSVGVHLQPFTCGYLVLGAFTAAYMAGAYRAGIDAVGRGQWEAATALNLPTRTVWWRIVLPQALPPIIPALGNWVNATFKLTAYLNVIGVMGLLGYALQVAQVSYSYFEPLTIVGLSYLIISIAATILIRLIEFAFVRRRRGGSFA